MPAFESYGLIGLFLLCFLAATILPLSSEALVLFFLHSDGYQTTTIITVASLGNILGGLTNYALGYFSWKIWSSKRKSKSDKKAFILAEKYGFVAAFFSWIPFVGDPMLVALGFLKSSFWKTFLLMSAGKVLRYLFLLLI